LIFQERGEEAFRERSDVLALGNSVAAAVRIRSTLTDEDIQSTLQDVAAELEADSASARDQLQDLLTQGELGDKLRDVAAEFELSLFLFDENGRLLSPERSRATTIETVPESGDAVTAALEGERYVATLDNDAATVVALPLQLPGVGRTAVLTYVPQPELQRTVGIFRSQLVFATLIAVPVGAFAGLLVAMFLGWRLRRISVAAAAIEAGSFDTPLRPRFRDELGSLASSVDRMRQQLRQSFTQLEFERDRLGRLLERLHEGVITVSPDLEVEFSNAVARDILGDPDLVDGAKLPEPWPDFSLCQMAIGLFREEARVAQARVTPDELQTYAIVGIPAGTQGESAVFVLTDISEQERRERAEREFVTNAAHELKTPLTAISGAVEVLQAGAKEIPEDRDRFLSHIERESNRLGRLARALLVLARAQTNQEAPHLAPLQIRPLLENVAQSLPVEPGIAVDVVCDADLAALTERDLIEQVVANLGENAAKHTETGTIQLTARQHGRRRVVIEVSDSGSGIPTEEQERIFDRFFQGNKSGQEGFGLGLAIVRQSVRALGGTVDVNSDPGQGTTVRVTLPAAESGSAPNRLTTGLPGLPSSTLSSDERPR
jgi:signal transduction histidine kinase/HAMP domain-containing protein